MCVCVCVSVQACLHAKSPQSCLTLCNPTDCSLPGSSVHEDSPDKNTELGCHALLQGIFPTQGSSPSLMSPTLTVMFFTYVCVCVCVCVLGCLYIYYLPPS